MRLVLLKRGTLLAQLLFVQLLLLHLAKTLPASIVLHLGALHAEQSAFVPAQRDVASNEAAAGAAIMISVLSTAPPYGIAMNINCRSAWKIEILCMCIYAPTEQPVQAACDLL